MPNRGSVCCRLIMVAYRGTLTFMLTNYHLSGMMRTGYAAMGDLQLLESSASSKHGVRDMLVNWIDVRSKVTHFGALTFAWFWSEYVTNKNFQNGVDLWVNGLGTFWRALFGASICFYMWYRNPNRKAEQ